MTGGPHPAAWARVYASRGWSVLPLHTPRAAATPAACSCGRRECAAPGKHPRVRWERFTGCPPTTAEVEAWFRRWPDANVGVVTGLVSGVVVLDVDPRNGGEESLAGLGEGRLPPTASVRTGGGGRHLWFAAPEAPVASRPLAPGLELKGEGGLVVVPPSLHVSGERYSWVAQSPLAPLPPFLAVEAHRRGPGGGPVRTGSERAEFAAAWRRAGIDLRPGDDYYLCPFHPDHHPSLHVDADGCRWYCFGCGRGGGVGAVLDELGEPTPPRARARLRGAVGPPRPVTVSGPGETPVVGEAEHQDVLLTLTGGRRTFGGVDVEAVADLVPLAAEPGGVAVVINGETVGHLRREDATRLLPAIEESLDTTGMATVRAVVRGGWDRGGDDVGLFGVVLRA